MGRHQSCAVVWSALILVSSLYCVSATPPPPTVTGVTGGPFGYSGELVNYGGLVQHGFNVTGTGLRNVACFWSSSTQPLWNQTVDVPNDSRYFANDGSWVICPPAQWTNGYGTPVTLSVSAGGSALVPVTGGNFDPVDTRNFQATATFNNQSMDYPGYNLAGSGWGTMTLSQQGGITTFSLNWPNFSVPNSNGTLVFHVHNFRNYTSTCGNNGGHYFINGVTSVPVGATITISGGVATASVPSDLVQLAGGFSVLGKSVVIHYPNLTIVACATILPIPDLPTLYGDCVFDNNDVLGRLHLTQNGLDPTVVSARGVAWIDGIALGKVYSGPTCMNPGAPDPAYTGYAAPLPPGDNSGTTDALQLTGQNSVFNKTFVVFDTFQMPPRQIGCCPFRQTAWPNGVLSVVAPLRVCVLMMIALAVAFLVIG